MDPADQIIDPESLDPAVGASESTNECSARATALQQRIRELQAKRNGAKRNDPANRARPDSQSHRTSDTRPASTTELESHTFADLARLVNRSSIGSLPKTPLTNASESPTGPSHQQARRRWIGASPGLTETTDRSNHSVRTWHMFLPVWLTSALIHATLLILLALLTYSEPPITTTMVVTSRIPEQPWTPAPPSTIELHAPISDSDEPLMAPNAVDTTPIHLNVSAELTTPTFSAAHGHANGLSDQLRAVQKIQDRGDLRRTRDETGAQFYGIQADGNRFVFIVDSSTSMSMKFIFAKQELEKAVKGLNQDQLFYVIFFDRDAERLRLGKWNGRRTRYSMNKQPERDLVAATDENIDGLIYWMNSIQLDSDTNPHSAVVFALRKLQPDAVFLLSDGEFNDGGSTESFLLRENFIEHPTEGPTPKTIVHCVGFHSHRGEITLKRIAEANGGTYRFIKPPRRHFPMAVPMFGGGRPTSKGPVTRVRAR